MTELTQDASSAEQENQEFFPGFVAGVQELQKLWDNPNDSQEIISPPSEVIGYADDEERAVLDNPLGAGFSYHDSPESEEELYRSVSINSPDLQRVFPNLAALISADLVRIGASTQGLDDAAISQVVFQHGILTPLEDELSEDELPEDFDPQLAGWHFDNPDKLVKDEEVAMPPEIFYVLATKITTETYEGKANAYSMVRSDGNSWRATTGGGNIIPDDTSKFDRYPEYALVRLSPLAYHRTPQPNVPTERTFFRVTVQPHQDWENFVLTHS